MGASEKTLKLKSSNQTTAYITTEKPYFSPLKNDKQTKAFCLYIVTVLWNIVKMHGRSYCIN